MASVIRTGSGRELRAERRHLERQAAFVLVAVLIAFATVCAGIIASGWFAGVIQDRYERVFWLGAVVAALSVPALAGAVWPGGSDDEGVTRRIRLLLRVALVLLVAGPALCIGSLVADFFG